MTSKSIKLVLAGFISVLCAFPPAIAATETNGVIATQARSATIHTNTVSANATAEAMRTHCINGRRAICGRVLKILPDGLVVDSGYTELQKPPFNQTWVTSGGASVSKDAKLLELNEPGSACVGIVFLTDIPRRPPVKQYDYVSLIGYPAGHQAYSLVPGVEKTVRRFAAGLDTAVRLNLEADESRNAP